jgi:hypothetical protein
MKNIFSFLFLIVISLPTVACPLCNSNTAKDVRASIFGPDLSFNLFVTIFPFLIFGTIVFFIYRGINFKRK